MRKIDIERMQRLEEIVERQVQQIQDLEAQLEAKRRQELKLLGANEALTALVERLTRVAQG